MTSRRPGPGPFITAVPGLDVVDFDSSDGPRHVILRTPSTTLRLEGGVARVVRDRILPALAQPLSRAELLDELSDLPAAEIHRLVGSLLDSGVLVEENGAAPDWLYAVPSRDDDLLARRLATMRVAVVGQVEVLVGAGIPGLIRAPYPSRREELPALMAGADLVVAAGDGSLPVLHQWVNAVGLELGVPTLHVELQAAGATVGPLVLPDGGPCYLCWRMRALSCVDDFSSAMALEEALDARRFVDAAARPVLPALLPMVTAALMTEVFALTLSIAAPRLAANVLTLDALVGGEELHPVIPHPDCPACAKNDRPPVEAETTDFEDIAGRAVDSLCGVVRRLVPFPKDIDEPERPYVVQAELANAGFRTDGDPFVVCSGKGWTRRQARDSALGEALERHAAMTWRPERTITSTYDGLDRPGLHPRDLVLFADHQYGTVPFQPWRPETEVEWVPGLSLVSGDEVWIPLLATHLGYRPPPSAGLFPTTSNGFAAGPDFDGATLRALLEVIERDAFMIAWSHRLPGRCVAAADVPDEQTRGIAATHARRGIEIVVHLLPTDTVAAVALAVAWSDRMPAAVVGLGAGMDPAAAARSAVLEVGQARPLLRARLRQPGVRARMAGLVAMPAKVGSLGDHSLLYADSAVGGMRFLREAPRQPWPDIASPGPADSAVLIKSLAEVAGDVLAVDVTTPDVAELGVRVVRGLVPGFVPIWFGVNQARLGGRRLLEMPSRIGLRPARLDHLNLDPHPMA
ncbi:TOMM precursor leader peptide-binding protein [Kribbella capetownensis]|uniref:TOMM leader peptide-binding protein n=1 Tax=Kribbella capetownensis TaxID=1572659 RepID=A0A4R0JE49_9ACTN|nr:TOMM precursor leader peptide-binding protein [Kribbella capetownensis]TCC42906.1 TOMM precursor leader peptide-binding protein [Kribbella capetownensis]